MAKCEVCGKGVTFGIKVSHSHRRSNRTWKPNVKRVKAIVDGAPKAVKEKASKAEAEDIKKKLEEAGAKVEVK